MLDTNDPIQLQLNLVNEDQFLRRKFEPQWEVNEARYAGRHWDSVPQGRTPVTVNLIKRSIDAIVAVMTESRPKTSFAPVESNSPGIFFVRQPDGANLAAKLAQEGVPIAGIFDPQAPQDGPLMGTMPLLADQAQALQPFTQPQGDPAAGLVAPPLLDPKALIKVDDSTIADVLTTIYDAMWSNGHWDAHVAGAISNAMIIGHQDVILSWDDEAGAPVWYAPPAKNTWIDPAILLPLMGDANHFSFVNILSVDAACEMFPDKAEEIRKNPQQSFVTFGNATLSNVFNILWQQDMAMIVTTWIRDQQIPMTGPDGEPVLDEATGQPQTRVGIRQIRTVSGVLIEDAECPFSDIPAMRFTNIPIPNRPYTIGEPEILDSLQQAINRLISNLCDHTRFFAAPQTVMAQSVMNGMRAKDLYNTPNRTIPVPDQLLQLYGGDVGKMIQTLYPPPLSQTYMAYLEFLVATFHDLAGQSDVIRGNPDPEASSGRAILALQSAARGTIGYRSLWISESLCRLGSLVRDMIVTLMTPEQWKLYTDAYPVEVLAAMHSRARDARFNTTVEISGSSEASRQEKQQKAVLMRQQGDLSQQTFLTDMGNPDPEKEIEKIMAEQAQKAQLAAALTPPQEQGGGKPGGPGEKKDQQQPEPAGVAA